MRCALRAEKCGRGKKGDQESGRKELTQRHRGPEGELQGTERSGRGVDGKAGKEFGIGSLWRFQSIAIRTDRTPQKPQKAPDRRTGRMPPG